MKRLFNLLIVCVFSLILSCLQTTALASTHYLYEPKTLLTPMFSHAASAHGFPGGCVTAGTLSQTFVDHCYGYMTYRDKTADRPNDLFDLASLTKVVATTSAVMKLYDEGKIHLNDKVVHYLPQFTGPTQADSRLKSTVTIKELLTHTSGLHAILQYHYVSTHSTHQIFQAILKMPLLHKPGTQYHYSDLNFVLLGKIVQKISGKPLNVFVENNIFKPLGMNHTFYLPNKSYDRIIVPTLYVHHEYLKGEVNDPTARDLGGVSGNAGLFSNLHDLSIFAKLMLNYGRYHGVRIFKTSTIKLFTQRANIVPGSSRALGWDTVYNPKRFKAGHSHPHQFTAGIYVDPNAFGHTGHTGTSLWIDPAHGIYVIALTNYVFPNNYHTQAQRYWLQHIVSAIWHNAGFNQKNNLYREPFVKNE